MAADNKLVARGGRKANALTQAAVFMTVGGPQRDGRSLAVALGKFAQYWRMMNE